MTDSEQEELTRLRCLAQIIEEVVAGLEHAAPNSGCKGYVFIPKDALAKLLAWRAKEA